MTYALLFLFAFLGPAETSSLKKLNVAFKTLYEAMPDAQKKVADETFRTYGRDNAKHG